MKNIPDILRKIVAVKREEIAGLRRNELEAMSRDASPPRDFEAALRRDGISVIAEVKKASPSAGEIVGASFDPVAMAEAYEEGGADAVSVLTDRHFFKGELDYLTSVRNVVSLPVLRKDFIMDTAQVFESRAAGADSFLLIAAILDAAELADLVSLGRSMGMEPLVESHDEKDLEKSIEAGGRILGINNRNLHTFDVDLGTSERLASIIASSAVAVSESGIVAPNDAWILADAGYDAVLVGEAVSKLSSDGKKNFIRKIKACA